MTFSERNKLALTLLRVTLSVLIAIQGWHRFIEGEVGDFSSGLDHRGYPLGMVVAYSITGLEMAGWLVFCRDGCGRM